MVGTQRIGREQRKVNKGSRRERKPLMGSPEYDGRRAEASAKRFHVVFWDEQRRNDRANTWQLLAAEPVACRTAAAAGAWSKERRRNGCHPLAATSRIELVGCLARWGLDKIKEGRRALRSIGSVAILHVDAEESCGSQPQ